VGVLGTFLTPEEAKVYLDEYVRKKQLTPEQAKELLDKYLADAKKKVRDGMKGKLAKNIEIET